VKIAVTGAFSYSGKYITRRLLARGDDVVTLTGHPNRLDPFGGQVPTRPLDFGRTDQLQESLKDRDILVNTYWIRFDRGSNTQKVAVENTRRLLTAASQAGVRRVIHVSITNPSLDSPLPYFQGKAQNEGAVVRSGMSYAILRPTVLFGAEDILINNIAFLLRRFPIFFIAGPGTYRLQPVYVDDLAELVVQAVYRADNTLSDAVGPETLTFRELVGLIGVSIGRPRPLLSVPPGLLLLAARLLSLLLGDVLLTRHELEGLMGNLLVSEAPPLGKGRLSEWLRENRATVGRRYASELKRHY
jgi:NADH dehydrogenase